MKTHVTTVTMTCDQCGRQVEHNAAINLEAWVTLTLTVNYAAPDVADLCSMACATAWLSERLAARVGKEWAHVTVSSEVTA